MQNSELRPARAVVATLLGGVIGAFGIGYVTGWLAEATRAATGLAAVGIAVVAGGLGALVGAGTALWLAFRDEPGRERLVTVVTMLGAGLALFAVLQGGLANLDPSLSLPPVHLAFGLAGGAVIGRVLARRSAAHRD